MSRNARILAAMLVSTLMSCSLQAQTFDARGMHFRSPESRWIDSVMNQMTMEQKVAQLMVVRVPLNMTDEQAADFSARMNGYGVGGMCFFAGTAIRQAALTRQFQHDATMPLLIAIDAEWGLGMRLKDMFSFPRNAKFGQLAPGADSLVYRMGEEIGLQCRKMGIHINFAPVVDINSNPKNPVIGTRSFGTDRERVSQLGIMYMQGLQSHGVMAVAKHFPGHGDTDADSHLELPVINHSLAYIDTIDLYPFRRMIEAGVQGVMTAHLQVNAIDAEHPSSLSPKMVDGLLRKQMGFDGMIITDGLDMKGVTNTYGAGNGELAALLAGNDILLLPPDVPKAIETITNAANKTDSVRAAVDYHCRRILEYKYRNVLPRMDEPVSVPDDDDMERCHDIVRELYFNIDRRIDSIVNNAIDSMAMPGCQVVVMHRGEVKIDRCYGRQTYDNTSLPVTPETIYDLASLTKVCATTLAVMKLVDERQLSLDDPLSKYLPYLDSTDKRSITVREVMSHQARLKAFDAYWQKSNNRDSILLMVAQSPINADSKMVYSDLGFMLMADVVERVSGMPLERYVDEYFYRPMGLSNTMFRPLENSNVDPQRIAPTELDTIRGLIKGNVHDPNAYAMGGVSGHAGLFSNARDVATLMQMLLNGGELNGRRYISKETLAIFTNRHFADQGNRRALGFDKQLFSPSTNGQTCPEASQASYGHTGFTGTMVWVDPQFDLVYVFLSNRVYPTSTPNKLARMNVRTDIQSVLYSILKQ